MAQLDFAALEAVQQILCSAALDDLVAVLSTRAGERRCLVYNRPSPPDNIPPDVKVMLLSDLDEGEIDLFDGLLVGLPALDVIFSNLHVKGPLFYPLEPLLLRFGGRAGLHRTQYNLARHLTQQFSQQTDSACTFQKQPAIVRILELALPALLDEREARGQATAGLIAVQPGPDLTAFVEGESGTWLYAGAAPEMVVGLLSQGWLVALDQVRALDPEPVRIIPRFVELRRVLRQAGYDAALRQSCRALAWRFANEAQGRSDYSIQAWALMTEAWLMDEDVTDLVALFPHKDFQHFAATGEGWRVYRVLDERAQNTVPGPRRRLAGLALPRPPLRFLPWGFSLADMEPSPSQPGDRLETRDLSKILMRAGHVNALARTLLLLARDGLQTKNQPLPAETLLVLARQAMMLVGQGDPWQWRQGRGEQLTANAYQTLGRALEFRARIASTPDSNYYRALIDWYNCYNASGDQVARHLDQMARRLRAFLRTTQHNENDAHVICARQLIEIEEAAVYPLAAAGARPESQPQPGDKPPFDSRAQHRSLATGRREAGCLSPAFQPAWRQLQELRHEHHQVLVHERNRELQQRKLEDLLTRARRQHRLLSVLPNETAVLSYIYEREIQDLERRVHELRTEASLEILPLNPRLDFQREVALSFEVRNASRIKARDVEIVLARDSSFDLLDHSFIREFDLLGPGTSRRFQYRVRAVHKSSAVFKLSYTCRGLGSNQIDPIELPVHSLDTLPFKMKGDPYRFGRAITEPADFYGRREEIRRILASLYRGGQTNFMLRGPRRMGKTSMLNMLKAALEEAEIRRRFDIPKRWDRNLKRITPVMLDLQAFDFQDDATHIPRFFYNLLDAISETLAPELRSEVLNRFERRWHQLDAPRAALEGLDKVLRRRKRTQVVVLLDEYDEIYRPQGRGLDTALRHVVQNEPRLTWIIASTQFLFQEGKSHGSPWFNILDTVELDCLSKEAARRLIEEPSANERVEWQSDAIVSLQEETGRHPAFLQLFCSRIMAYLNREKQNYVLPASITELAEMIVEERETIHTYFEFYWADTSGVGRLILLAADEGQRPLTHLGLRKAVRERLTDRFEQAPTARVQDARGSPVPWWVREFDDGLTWVSDVVKAITFDKATKTYSFTVPLFRRWLRHKRHDEDLVGSALDKVALEMERDGLF